MSNHALGGAVERVLASRIHKLSTYNPPNRRLSLPTNYDGKLRLVTCGEAV
jgi:hypothetical protein